MSVVGRGLSTCSLFNLLDEILFDTDLAWQYVSSHLRHLLRTGLLGRGEQASLVLIVHSVTYHVLSIFLYWPSPWPKACAKPTMQDCEV